MSVLHARVRHIEQRLAVRAWEYRQRTHARGVWFRLRRVLADAERAFVISPEDAAALERLELAAEPVGLELQPPRYLYFVPSDVLRRLGSAREIPVRLSAELLGAEHVALVRFP